MGFCSTPSVIVVSWPIVKLCFLLVASPKVAKLLIDTANAKVPLYRLPKFPGVTPSPPPLSDKPNILFVQSVIAHKAVFDYCPRPFGLRPCEKMNSTNARKTPEGLFCSKTGKCVYLRDPLGDTPMTYFIDGWAKGFNEQWMFCTSNGTSCDSIDSNLFRSALSGILCPTNEGITSIYAVLVSTTDLHHPPNLVPPVARSEPQITSRKEPVPRNKKRYWFVLALITLTCLAMIYEIILAVWFLNIYIRGPGRFERWIKWQFWSFGVNGLLTVLYIAVLFAAFLSEEKIMMWLVVYIAVELLTTARAGWLLLATQKQIVPLDAAGRIYLNKDGCRLYYLVWLGLVSKSMRQISRLTLIRMSRESATRSAVY